MEAPQRQVLACDLLRPEQSSSALSYHRALQGGCGSPSHSHRLLITRHTCGPWEGPHGTPLCPSPAPSTTAALPQLCTDRAPSGWCVKMRVMCQDASGGPGPPWPHGDSSCCRKHPIRTASPLQEEDQNAESHGWLRGNKVGRKTGLELKKKREKSQKSQDMAVPSSPSLFQSWSQVVAFAFSK